MQTSRTRLAAISAATFALILAGTASVAARPGDRGDAFGFDQGPMGRFGQRGDLRSHFWDRFGGPLAGAAVDGFVRTESTYQTEDGLVTHRVDNGTVSSVGDSSVDYTLATAESASVITDEDTQVIAFSEQTVEFGRRGFSQQRLMPESVELGAITAGSEVVIWAESQDDGTFLAQRIVVQPPADEAAAEADAGDVTDAAPTDDAAAAADA